MQAGLRSYIWVVLLAYILYGLCSTFFRINVYKPIEDRVRQTSENIVYTHNYEVAPNLRIAKVHPFGWRLLNHNNEVVFLLPKGTAGYRCPPQSTVGAIFNRLSNVELSLNCYNVNVEDLDKILAALPYERTVLYDSAQENDYYSIKAVDIINILLRKGVFTLEHMQ